MEGGTTVAFSGRQFVPGLFDVKEIDRQVYTQELEEFLPPRMVDAHTHVWRDADTSHDPRAFDRVASWPMRVARENLDTDLVESYRLLFPDCQVTPLMFSLVNVGDNADALNRYVSVCAAARKFPALIFAHPSWTGEDLERRIRTGGFIGAKVYLNLSPNYLPRNEIRILDFLPPHQLDVLHANRWVTMLHIPRDGRLRDPVNLAQMLEIEKNWPGAKLIIAHVGRAYCDEDVGDAFEVLRGTRNMAFDFSGNTNAHVFERALRTFGPGRCLFGSDLPITRMRMRRTCEDGTYVNIVPRGLYGDVSADRNMREVDPPESDTLTFFLYEELRAIRTACRNAGCSRADVEDIFFNNARRLLGF
jgi:predicted TIM-barrel fold metal-dependent hydrolase